MRDVGLDPAGLESNWIYVGDSPNDASPFAAMDLSIGVSSVRAFEGKMSAWPRFVTEGGPGVGFGEVILRLLSARDGAA
jgi:hypothetical protein